MKTFRHIDAGSVEEACALLSRYAAGSVLNAGGTDLLSALKGRIAHDYPEVVINIKTIPDLDYIREEGNSLKIGALARLSDIVKSPVLRERYSVLVEAAHSVATPPVRNMATLGGNLCQDVRCWYYRYPHNVGGPIACLRKGEGKCLAVSGDNRYHAIFGGRKCFAVCPSDTAVALAALNGRIEISGPKGKRTVAATDFFNPLDNALEQGEMVTEIEVPAISGTVKQNFLKFTLREPVDFAVVSVASVLTLEKGICVDARIALGAVAPGPLRAKKAEEALKGCVIDESSAVKAAELAVSDAKPLSKNAYKIEVVKALLKRAIMGEPS